MKGLRQTPITIATAHDLNQAILIQMLLNRADISYRMRGESLHYIYGPAASFSPIEFVIHAQDYLSAKEVLEGMFSVEADSLPEECPACLTPTVRNQMDCPSCGLFLG